LQDLENLKLFIEEANRSNSINDKLEVIKKFPQCRDLWRYTYDTLNYQYGVTAANIKKLKPKLEISWTLTPHESLPLLLSDLNEKRLTGHDAIRAVLRFIQDHKEYEDIILNVIDRNLKTRTDIKLFNKAFPELIPQFEISLANHIDDYDPKRTKINFEKDIWLSSRKMNGCRCVVKIDNDGAIEILSKTGHEFWTLDILKENIGALNLRSIVLDGEVCLIDHLGMEHFQEIMKYIRKKNFTIPNPRYKIFDLIPYDDFEEGQSSLTLMERQDNLKEFVQENSVLSILEQFHIHCWNELDTRKSDAVAAGWEGLIIRKNTPYEAKRSNDMLKVKVFKDAEYEVQDVEMGPIRYIDYDENGKSFENEETMLSAIMIDHKGSIVRVGSGFSLEERKYYFAHPEELIGKDVTVKYFEETKNQQGGLSLQFPTIDFIWKEGKRDV
jgi:DNA ligase 1